jgi:hypothetical protein
MSISFDETLVTLAETARIFPGRPHSSTLWRWYTHGVRGVRLETLVVAGRRFCSREAIERFVTATTAAANGDPLPVRTPHQRQRDIAKAEREVGIADNQEVNERSLGRATPEVPVAHFSTTLTAAIADRRTTADEKAEMTM